MAFKEFDIVNSNFNPFSAIGKEWFLLTAGSEDNFNTMTASWGGAGVIWRKNVFLTVVRESRYTLGFIDDNDCFSASFLSEEYRRALNYCGSHSGKDEDKVKNAGLTPIFIDGVPAFEEADKILICKKVARQVITTDSFIDPSIGQFYVNDALHVAYTGEIIKAYEKE